MFGKRRIVLDEDLWERVVRCARAAGYASPQEFVLHVLEKELAPLDSTASEEELRSRLRGLGYIE
jgi:hypothetical protein